MSTSPTTPSHSTTHPMPATRRPVGRYLAFLGISLTAALGLVPQVAFAGPGNPVPPVFQGDGPGPTTTVDPQVNPDLEPGADGYMTPTTPPETFPPQPPDPQVNPDVEPGADGYITPTTPPETIPPPDDDDDFAPNPDLDCEPFSPDYPVVDMAVGGSSATVELSFQGDDQLQICVTPLVVASYALDQPGLGGEADLIDHEVVSSEDLDDWLLTGEPHQVTVDTAGCYQAVVVFWNVAIPLDLDGVEDPPHVLAMETAGDGQGCDNGPGDPGGDPGGRLPDTGGDAFRLVTLAALLVGSGLVIVLAAHRRRATA